jgi:hypothetical protein
MEVSGQLQAPAIFFRGKNPCTHLMGRCMGPKASTDDLENEKVPVPTGIRIPYLPVRSPGTTLITISRLLSL